MRRGFTLLELTLALALVGTAICLAGSGAARCVRATRLAQLREAAARAAAGVADSVAVAPGGVAGELTRDGIIVRWREQASGGARLVDVVGIPLAAPSDSVTVQAVHSPW